MDELCEYSSYWCFIISNCGIFPLLWRGCFDSCSSFSGMPVVSSICCSFNNIYVCVSTWATVSASFSWDLVSLKWCLTVTSSYRMIHLIAEFPFSSYYFPKFGFSRKCLHVWLGKNHNKPWFWGGCSFCALNYYFELLIFKSNNF